MIQQQVTSETVSVKPWLIPVSPVISSIEQGAGYFPHKIRGEKQDFINHQKEMLHVFLLLAGHGSHPWQRDSRLAVISLIPIKL